MVSNSNVTKNMFGDVEKGNGKAFLDHAAKPDFYDRKIEQENRISKDKVILFVLGVFCVCFLLGAIFCTGSGGVFVVRKAGGNPIVAIGPAGGGTPDQADAFPFGSSYPQATVQKQLDLVQQLQSIDPMLKSDFNESGDEVLSQYNAARDQTTTAGVDDDRSSLDAGSSEGSSLCVSSLGAAGSSTLISLSDSERTDGTGTDVAVAGGGAEPCLESFDGKLRRLGNAVHLTKGAADTFLGVLNKNLKPMVGTWSAFGEEPKWHAKGLYEAFKKNQVVRKFAGQFLQKKIGQNFWGEMVGYDYEQTWADWRVRLKNLAESPSERSRPLSCMVDLHTATAFQVITNGLRVYLETNGAKEMPVGLYQLRDYIDFLYEKKKA